MNAASSPAAVSWYGNLAMVGTPDTLATNSALGGTLNRLPEHFLLGATYEDRSTAMEDEIPLQLAFLKRNMFVRHVARYESLLTWAFHDGS